MFNNPFYLETMMTEQSKALAKADRQGWLVRKKQISSSPSAALNKKNTIYEKRNTKKGRLPEGSRP